MVYDEIKMSEQLQDVNLDELDLSKSIFQGLKASNLLEKVVDKAVDNSQELDTKTELNKIVEWGVFKTFEDYLEKHKFNTVSDLFQIFRISVFRFSISKKRAGKKELIELVNAISHFQKEQTETENVSKFMQKGI